MEDGELQEVALKDREENQVPVHLFTGFRA